jgi:hypothetical protein
MEWCALFYELQGNVRHSLSFACRIRKEDINYVCNCADNWGGGGNKVSEKWLGNMPLKVTKHRCITRQV